MEALKNYFAEWTMFEKVWLFVSVVLLTVASVMWKSPWYGYVASISGMICVVLVAKGKISNYWFGIVNCTFYAYVAYGWQLYGEVMLNLMYFLPMQFVGLYYWSRKDNVQTNGGIRVKFLSNISRFGVALTCMLAIGGYAIFLDKIEGRIPLIDSTSTVLSVVAMVLMARLYMEQWILWIIIDVVSIAMWVIVVFRDGSNDIGLLIMWSAFLVNALYGFYNWCKMYRERTV